MPQILFSTQISVQQERAKRTAHTAKLVSQVLEFLSLKDIQQVTLCHYYDRMSIRREKTGEIFKA